MRIGIITLPLRTNYGGILQAFALQTTLERMGHEVQIIGAPNIPFSLPFLHRCLSIVKRFLQKYILGQKNIVLDRVKGTNDQADKSATLTRKFIGNHIHLRVVNNFREIAPDDYNAYVVGSDQIWREIYNKKWYNQKIDDVYLGFTKGWNVKRIAYAASFGKDEIEITESNDLQKCREAIAAFDAVSVREESGINICKRDLLYDNAVLMPDPTLLLSMEDYVSLVPNIEKESDKRELMSYVLDDNGEKIVLRERIAKDKNLKINITNKGDNWKLGDKIKPQPPVEDWLKAFAESNYVITDSFHACVFSIIFHKQFTVIANKERGLARFKTLLKMFGLEDRMILSPDEYEPLPDIDYDKVQIILDTKRKEALGFLKSNL